MTNPPWSTSINLTSKLPIDLTQAKPYVLVDVPFNEDHWTRVYTIENEIVVARLTQKQSVSRKLKLVVEAIGDVSDLLDEVIERVTYECDLDDTFDLIREERKKDVLIDIAVKKSPGYRLYAGVNPVEVAVLSLLSMNDGYLEGIRHREEFLSEFGNTIPWDQQLRQFPSDEKLVDIPEKAWKKFGAGFNSSYLANLTEADLEAIRNYSLYPIYERGLNGLQSIEGIGEYISRSIMIYSSRRYKKAIKDPLIMEMLEHKYNLSMNLTFKEYDNWINERWPNQPAKILHTHMVEYLPTYISSVNYDDLRPD